MKKKYRLTLIDLDFAIEIGWDRPEHIKPDVLPVFYKEKRGKWDIFTVEDRRPGSAQSKLREMAFINGWSAWDSMSKIEQGV